MNFHESPDFRDAIEAAASALKLRPLFVEKDYWVCYVLRNLSGSDYADKVVFKGGTALSKAWKCIERFSEDIDLAILPEEGRSNSQSKKLVKDVPGKIAGVLQQWAGHEDEDLGGYIRKVVYAYPKVTGKLEYGIMRDHILIETNCFTNPVPFTLKPIQSYVGEFLENTGEAALVAEYSLQPCSLQVLSLERTFFEKVLSLINASYDGTAALGNKVRHLYDIHQLLHCSSMADVMSAQGYPVLRSALQDEQQIRAGSEERGLSSAPLFAQNSEELKKGLSSAYNELAQFVWTPLPPLDIILQDLERIRQLARHFETIESSEL